MLMLMLMMMMMVMMMMMETYENQQRFEILTVLTCSKIQYQKRNIPEIESQVGAFFRVPGTSFWGTDPRELPTATRQQSLSPSS